MKNTTDYSDARVMSAAEKMLVQKGYCIEVDRFGEPRCRELEGGER